MSLLTKFSLLFVMVFGLGLTATSYLFYSMTQNDARQQVQDRARVLMETALAMRNYTSEHIKPLLAATAATNNEFYPEIVPAFSATTMFNYLKGKYPGYSYKEASLNPTNPRDRATDWEADIINDFRNHPDMELFSGERMTPSGLSLYMARPLRAEASCMECHSTPDAAPPAMLALYGRDNGFGWKENDVIAAQIVSIPATLPVQMAKSEFLRLMGSLVAVGIATLLVLNLVLVLTVIRPVSRLASRADQISKGQMDVPELPAKGKDEISVLASAFNRMHRSLVAAMKMLDKH